MCFSVAFGNNSVFCCFNGSFVNSAAGPLWSTRSSLCPPLEEEAFPAGGGFGCSGRVYLAVWSGLQFPLPTGRVVRTLKLRTELRELN